MDVHSVAGARGREQPPSRPGTFHDFDATTPQGLVEALDVAYTCQREREDPSSYIALGVASRYDRNRWSHASPPPETSQNGRCEGTRSHPDSWSFRRVDSPLQLRPKGRAKVTVHRVHRPLGLMLPYDGNSSRRMRRPEEQQDVLPVPHLDALVVPDQRTYGIMTR